MTQKTMDLQIHIKNMVCPRCIASVIESLTQVDIPYSSVELGRVTLHSQLSTDKKVQLDLNLKLRGFELLEDRKSLLISQIKNILIDQIQHSEFAITENYSTFISEKLSHEYTSLSRLFSQVEGITIEKYINRLKIERVKELIFYNEKSLSEIAELLSYSSVAYLSSQFKKETGMTSSEFRNQTKTVRKSLDQL